MSEHLHDIFREQVLSGKVSCREFLASIEDKNPNGLLDLMTWIVTTIPYSDNPDVIKATFDRLAHLRVTEHLKDLQQIRSQWQNTYYNEYEYLLALFENGMNGANCNCSVYQDARFNAPPFQKDLEIVGEWKREDGHYSFDIFTVRCKGCGAEWEVEVDHIYHYPHSHWKRIS